MREASVEFMVGTLILLGSITAAVGGSTLAMNVFNFVIASAVLGAGLIDLYCARVERRLETG